MLGKYRQLMVAVLVWPPESVQVRVTAPEVVRVKVVEVPVAAEREPLPLTVQLMVPLLVAPVARLIEKALALADRVYALAGGSIVLEAGAKEADLANRLEHAYFGQDVSSPLGP